MQPQSDGTRCRTVQEHTASKTAYAAAVNDLYDALVYATTASVNATATAAIDAYYQAYAAILYSIV